MSYLIMKNTIKYLFYFVVLILLLGVGFYAGSKLSFFNSKTEISQEILLERVENVVKLGTVEGVFSEIFKYSDYYTYDISPFRKKALIKIRAHVLIGYDLDSMEVKIDHFRKKIRIKELPDPGIISIDHDLEYYDITEGTFNSFTTDDYNMLQKQSKDYIRKKANESDLFVRSEKQLHQHLSALNWILKDSGWEIVMPDRTKIDL